MSFITISKKYKTALQFLNVIKHKVLTIHYLSSKFVLYCNVENTDHCTKLIKLKFNMRSY